MTTYNNHPHLFHLSRPTTTLFMCALRNMHSTPARVSPPALNQLFLTDLHVCCCACVVLIVLEGMDVVKKIEALGSGSGKPSKKIAIKDSGELK